MDHVYYKGLQKYEIEKNKKKILVDAQISIVYLFGLLKNKICYIVFKA
jgi:hypothetical protein